MAKGKFIMDTKGNVKPLFANDEQWNEISKQLKNGCVDVHTSKGSSEVFAVLEVAKGYEGTGISNSEGMVTMIFSKKE